VAPFLIHSRRRAVRGGRFSRGLFEDAVELRQRLEAGRERDLADAQIAFEQEFYVLAKTKLLGPGESDSVTFTAPGAPGAYDYICTFPEHYAGGMKGVMTVRP
jgi:azurin